MKVYIDSRSLKCHNSVGDWNPGEQTSHIPRRDPRKWNTLSLPNSQAICQQRFDLKSRPEGKKLTNQNQDPYKCIYRVYLFGRWCSGPGQFLNSELLVSILRYLPWSNPAPEAKSLMRWAFLGTKDLWPLVSRTLKTDVFAVWKC